MNQTLGFIINSIKGVSAMQIVFVFTLLSAIIVYQSASLKMAEATSDMDPTIIAEQMQLWHQNAVEQCLDTNCSTGFVNPVQIAKENSIEDSSSFITWFDQATGWIMTNPSNNLIKSGKVGNGTLTAELGVLNRSQTFQLGTWDAQDNAVKYLSYTEFSPKLTLFMASHPIIDNLQDGSPLLISHIVP